MMPTRTSAKGVTFINSDEDMKWLRDVHLPRLRDDARSAILYGNEDSPVRIDMYSSAEPTITESPTDIYVMDDEGELVWNPGIAWALQLLAGHVQTVWRTNPPATIRFGIGERTVELCVSKFTELNFSEWDQCTVDGRHVGNRCGASLAIANAFAGEIKRIAKLELEGELRLPELAHHANTLMKTRAEIKGILAWLEDEEWDSDTCDEVARRLRDIVGDNQ